MFGFGPKIDVGMINSELTNGTALLVDVRRDEEWQAAHASGAMHLAIERISAGEVPSKDTSVKVYLYCATGSRAGHAASLLRQRGYDAENIGGLRGYHAAGGAIE